MNFPCFLGFLCLSFLLAEGDRRDGKIYKGKLPPQTSNFHRARKHRVRLGHSPFTCSDLHLFLRKKQELSQVLSKRINNLQTQQKNGAPSSSKVTNFKIKVLTLYQAELNASENSFYTVLGGLNRTLFSGYQSLDVIRLSCEARLNEMQTAALFVEGNHNDALKLVEESKLLNTSQSNHKLVHEILSEISHAADTLEDKLKEESFNDLVQGKGKSQLQGETEIETVLKLRDGNGHHRDQDQTNPDDQVVLIDSLSNRYTLSRPHDITVLIDDPYLVKDIVLLMVLCSLLGALCCLMGIPTLFGFGVAGMLLGPAGYNVVKCVVQVETVGELGAVFIIFMAGLEFSLEKLKKVFRFSLYGAGLTLLVCVLLTLIIGLTFGMTVKQCVFVAACLSLSSSTLINHLIEIISNTSKKRSSATALETIVLSSLDEPEASLVGFLQGLLVIQDVQMASLVALMPFFSSSNDSSLSFMSYLSSLVKLIQILLGFFLLLLLTHFLAHRALQPAFKVLLTVKSKGETLLFGSLTICFLLLAASLFLGASLELGCFLAGVAITALGSNIVDQIKKLVEPIRDLFSAIFFASVGFHVFLTFLMSEFYTIFLVTLGVVMFKLSVNLMLAGVFTGYSNQITWLSSLSMAQVSEFVFILCSRARRLRILTRETYLVLLSVTALSLILSPILWRLPRMALSIGNHQSTFRFNLTKCTNCISKRFFKSSDS